MKQEYDQELDAAVEQNEQDYDYDPRDGYRSPLWTFARIVRTLPPFRDLNADCAVLLLDDWLVRRGYKNPEQGWDEVFRAVVDDEGDAVRSFFEAFEQIRFGYGETLLGTILKRAENGELLKQLLQLPRTVLRGTKYRRFIAYAAEFQLYVGAGNPVLLPLHCTANTLHLNPETVSTYRRAAKKDGLLRETERYQARHSATKFTFDLKRLDQILAVKTIADALSPVSKEHRANEEPFLNVRAGHCAATSL